MVGMEEGKQFSSSPPNPAFLDAPPPPQYWGGGGGGRGNLHPSCSYHHHQSYCHSSPKSQKLLHSLQTCTRTRTHTHTHTHYCHTHTHPYLSSHRHPRPLHTHTHTRTHGFQITAEQLLIKQQMHEQTVPSWQNLLRQLFTPPMSLHTTFFIGSHWPRMRTFRLETVVNMLRFKHQNRLTAAVGDAVIHTNVQTNSSTTQWNRFVNLPFRLICILFSHFLLVCDANSSFIRWKLLWWRQQGAA